MLTLVSENGPTLLMLVLKSSPTLLILHHSIGPARTVVRRFQVGSARDFKTTTKIQKHIYVFYICIDGELVVI